MRPKEWDRWTETPKMPSQKGSHTQKDGTSPSLKKKKFKSKKDPSGPEKKKSLKVTAKSSIGTSAKGESKVKEKSGPVQSNPGNPTPQPSTSAAAQKVVYDRFLIFAKYQDTTAKNYRPLTEVGIIFHVTAQLLIAEGKNFGGFNPGICGEYKKEFCRKSTWTDIR